ncbi:RNA polymerase II-associated protein [Auriscalpium vulgare]|uniref:RNA polymerase II-associated protein n=1 Tax=Auriscalpium vulgare TaxID=40419 RepID=A0ACB8RRD8_9AGAM|nr:RNA polymerase II-associated protein [Auriscalpium vulgare]
MSTDALSALKAAVQAAFTIVPVTADGAPAALRDATDLRLSAALTLPKSTPTRLRKPGAASTATDPTEQSDAFFTLGAVWLAWQLRDAGGADYMKQAREAGLAVGFVSVTERKGIVEWLEGRAPAPASLVPLAESTTPPGTPPPSAYYKTLGGGPTPSRHGASHTGSSAPFSSSSSKRRYVPDSADVDVVKKIRQNEVELRDRNTVLRGVKPNNFTSVRTVFSAKLKSLKEAKKPGAAPAAAATPAPDPVMQARKQKNKYPIIMISSSPTSLITMHNVRKFLQDATFEPSADARARAAAEGNTRPEDMIPIYRNRTTIDSSGREVSLSQRYYVVDSVEALNKFGADAWDRVVCVLTTGQAWQFRPYKWTEPRSLFHHVKGIYVSWTNDPPNGKIKDWNVTELKIDPHRRHVDKSTVAHFWKMLDTWTVHNKPSLMKT